MQVTKPMFLENSSQFRCCKRRKDIVLNLLCTLRKDRLLLFLFTVSEVPSLHVLSSLQKKKDTQKVLFCFKTGFAVLCDDVNTANVSKQGALTVLDEI